MSQSTRRRGEGCAGGGEVGSWPAPPSAGGGGPAARRTQLVEALLRERCDAGLARLALRLRHDLRVPHGVLLTCGAAADELVSAGRVIAGRVSRAVAATAADEVPPHAAVVVPAATPAAWSHAQRVAAAEAGRHGCLVLARPPVTGLRALRAAYFRAVADASLARAAGTASAVVMPGELVIPRMLALLDDADQRALVAPIQPILALPRAHRSAYLHTLEALRRSGGTHATAAAELHVHVNTVRYRIDRIEAMTRRRLDDPADRIAIDLAAMLVTLRGLLQRDDTEVAVAESWLTAMDARDAPRRRTLIFPAVPPRDTAWAIARRAADAAADRAAARRAASRTAETGASDQPARRLAGMPAGVGPQRDHRLARSQADHLGQQRRTDQRLAVVGGDVEWQTLALAAARLGEAGRRAVAAAGVTRLEGVVALAADLADLDGAKETVSTHA